MFSETRQPWELLYDERAMVVTLDKVKFFSFEAQPRLLINGVNFNELPDAVVTQRQTLARSTTSINMNGYKKYDLHCFLSFLFTSDLCFHFL